GRRAGAGGCGCVGGGGIQNRRQAGPKRPGCRSRRHGRRPNREWVRSFDAVAALRPLLRPCHEGQTMPPLSNLAARDIETLIHPYTNLANFRDTGPLLIERGQGVFIYDAKGKAYIDGMAGLWCTALGHGNEELIEAATRQMRKLSFGHLFSGKSHDGAIELAEKIK